MTPTALLVSLRPEHADKVFRGDKTAELRRVKPRVKAGDLLFVYVSSPVKALYGICEVIEVITGSPAQLCGQVLAISGLTEQQFNEYYEGAGCAFVIVFKNAKCLPEPLKLACLQQQWTNFTAPQSYRYLSKKDIDIVNVLLETQTGKQLQSEYQFTEDPSLFPAQDELILSI